MFLLAWFLLFPNAKESDFLSNKDDKKYFDLSKIFEKINKGRSDKRIEILSDEARSLEYAQSLNSEELYWAALEPHFHRFITDLPSHPEQAQEQWQNEIRRAARAAFDHAVRCVSGDPRAYRAIAMSGSMFNIELSKIFPKQNPSQTQSSEEEI